MIFAILPPTALEGGAEDWQEKKIEHLLYNIKQYKALAFWIETSISLVTLVFWKGTELDKVTSQRYCGQEIGSDCYSSFGGKNLQSTKAGNNRKSHNRDTHRNLNQSYSTS